MTDRIALTGLRVRGHHGVLATERRAGQDFVVDVSLDLDLAPAASSDDVAGHRRLRSTGGGVSHRDQRQAGQPPGNLSPARSQTYAWLMPAWPRPPITVHKPQAPIRLNFDDVSVTMRRGRS